jgi:hypothetical protein
MLGSVIPLEPMLLRDVRVKVRERSNFRICSTRCEHRLS